MRTEYEFTLPKGYLDSDGNLHREGIMRLATAADEILPLQDPRVKQNPAYLFTILLSRVITRLGNLPAVDTNVVENMYSSDMAYLKDLYETINFAEALIYTTVCPHCGRQITVPFKEFKAAK